MAINKYQILITNYVDDQISTAEFEKTYLKMFKSEPEIFEDAIFLILEQLFSAVDSYWHECEPDQETVFMISEKTLKHEAKKALNAIDKIQEGEDFPI